MENWPFNTGDCLMQEAFMTGLTVSEYTFISPLFGIHGLATKTAGIYTSNQHF